MDEAVMMLLVFCLLILAGLAIMWLGVQSRRQVREMEHREKMAMIERGLVPPPELDPVGFEERMGARVQANASAVRARTAGVMMMGMGLALLLLITFAGGHPTAGFGLGGACAVIGAAFFVNARMLARDPAPPTPPLPPLPGPASRDSRLDT